MKRKRALIKANKYVDPEIQRLGISFADLPSSVTVDILLRLPIKSVLICRCVCKSWRNIISDPLFGKLHFKRAPVDIMIRTNDPMCVSRTLHLLEFEPEKFESEKFCSCVAFPKSRCKLHTKLEVKFKLPLRDAKLALDKMLEGKDGGIKLGSYISCKPKDDKFDVVNSCNGFLCLCDPKVRNPLVVCNPVTGEFIRLPEANQVDKFKQRNFDCGFGFDKRTNEYKVVRFYDRYVQDPKNAKAWSYNDRVVEMHTLGTGIWKYIGVFGNNTHDGLRFPTSMHGALHWLRLPSYTTGLSIIVFDFECESFHALPSPSNVFGKKGIMSTDNINMGELKGYLYICGSSIACPIILWVMKKYGVEESWTKIFSIDKYYAGARWPFDSYHPIKLFNNGTGLLFYQSCNWLIYYDLKKRQSQIFMVRGTQFKFEAMAHTPTLISLKNVLKGDHLQVSNVHSRCALFQLREEKEVLFLA